MPSIDGRLEWDDDELTPGKKKEGGLHSTLFDADGNLKSSARFLPNEDDRAAEPETLYMRVSHEVPAPPMTPEQEAFENAVAELLNRLVDYGIERLSPHAVRFWEDKARPALRSKVAKVTGVPPPRRAGPRAQRESPAWWPVRELPCSRWGRAGACSSMVCTTGLAGRSLAHAGPAVSRSP